MAKPPEPLQEILPSASIVVDAVVKEVVSTGPTPPSTGKPEEWTSKGTQNPEQQIVLTVNRVLRGKADAELRVTKPVAGYMVKAGTKGAWLVDDKGVILGRYGPDTWALDKVEAALK